MGHRFRIPTAYLSAGGLVRPRVIRSMLNSHPYGSSRDPFDPFLNWFLAMDPSLTLRERAC